MLYVVLRGLMNRHVPEAALKADLCLQPSGIFHTQELECQKTAERRGNKGCRKESEQMRGEEGTWEERKEEEGRGNWTGISRIPVTRFELGDT